MNSSFLGCELTCIPEIIQIKKEMSRNYQQRGLSVLLAHKHRLVGVRA